MPDESSRVSTRSWTHSTRPDSAPCERSTVVHSGTTGRVVGDHVRRARLREELGGYSPRAVDRAFERWASLLDKGILPSGTELEEVRFRRALRGYHQGDVD